MGIRCSCQLAYEMLEQWCRSREKYFTENHYGFHFSKPKLSGYLAIKLINGTQLFNIFHISVLRGKLWKLFLSCF